jgi:hypothetical protein
VSEVPARLTAVTLGCRSRSTGCSVDRDRPGRHGGGAPGTTIDDDGLLHGLGEP